jgi:hypothetical protein
MAIELAPKQRSRMIDEMITKAIKKEVSLYSGDTTEQVTITLESGVCFNVRDTSMFFKTACRLRPGDLISLEFGEVKPSTWVPDPTKPDRVLTTNWLNDVSHIVAKKGEWSDQPPEEFADRDELPTVALAAKKTSGPPSKNYTPPPPDTADAVVGDPGATTTDPDW